MCDKFCLILFMQVRESITIMMSKLEELVGVVNRQAKMLEEQGKMLEKQGAFVEKINVRTQRIVNEMKTTKIDRDEEEEATPKRKRRKVEKDMSNFVDVSEKFRDFGEPMKVGFGQADPDKKARQFDNMANEKDNHYFTLSLPNANGESKMYKFSTICAALYARETLNPELFAKGGVFDGAQEVGWKLVQAGGKSYVTWKRRGLPGWLYEKMEQKRKYEAPGSTTFKIGEHTIQYHTSEFISVMPTDEEGVNVLHNLLMQKFKIPENACALLATKKKLLVYTRRFNTDKPFPAFAEFAIVCEGENRKIYMEGENRMGMMLMRIRREIRQGFQAEVAALKAKSEEGGGGVEGGGGAKKDAGGAKKGGGGTNKGAVEGGGGTNKGVGGGTNKGVGGGTNKGTAEGGGTNKGAAEGGGTNKGAGGTKKGVSGGGGGTKKGAGEGIDDKKTGGEHSKKKRKVVSDSE